MSHRFGDLLTQHLHRKHGLSQAKLAAGILQDPAVIAKMCKGERLNGPQARERVVAIAAWLQTHGTLDTLDEANNLLTAAGMAPLTSEIAAERTLAASLATEPVVAAQSRAADSRTGNTIHSEIVNRGTTLPRPLTPFVGRDQDLDQLCRRLADRTCRLLTLTGLGGIGKTRLAIQVARLSAEAFDDGVHFVDLQPVADVNGLPYAIAESLRFALSSGETPLHQLQTYLANKRLMLLLDNFEHLLDQGADTVTAILTAAPDVRMMVTSRQPLNVAGEWQFHVRGVEYPPPNTVDSLDGLSRYDAVRLFVACAQRAQTEFSLPLQSAGIVRICRLTEGIPLAIEMAAAWTRSLSCQDIAHELEKSLAILNNQWRNTPARHRSMDATFEHSWQLLGESDRAVFARLSVCRGGFTRDAAAHIAGARIENLSALVNTSFLQMVPGGRYRIHELLRQFGEERLKASASDRDNTVARHMRYYAEMLHIAIRDKWFGAQQEVLALWHAESENFRSAWRNAISTKSFECISAMSAGIYWSAQLTSTYLEGYNAFVSARGMLGTEPQTDLTVKCTREVLIGYAWLALRIGRFDEADAACRQSLELHRQFQVATERVWGNDPVSILSICAAIRGNHADAEKLAIEARQRAARDDMEINIPVSGYVRASAALALGKTSEAQLAITESIEVCRRLREQWFLAYCLTTLGDIELARGDLAAARMNYSAAFDLRSLFSDAEGMALALKHLGDIALQTGDPSGARNFFERAVALYGNLNDRGGLAAVIKGMGDVECTLDRLNGAAQHYSAALQIAHDLGFVTLEMTVLLACATLFLKRQSKSQAADLINILLHHPACDERCRTHAAQLARQHGLEPTATTSNGNLHMEQRIPMMIQTLAALGQPSGINA